MKAVRLHELEGPEGLRYDDVPDPEPSQDEIVVRLRNAALNRRDLFATQGMYPGVKPDILPAIPGADGETWCGASRALKRGRRGLPGGESLAQLLLRHGKTSAG